MLIKLKKMYNTDKYLRYVILANLKNKNCQN